MNRLRFTKMQGAGNDFVVVDNRDGRLSEPLSELAARICDRRRGVGGDGLLLVEKSSRKAFRMRYFNADGSEAEMCGNGGRCIARFAALIGAAGTKMEFENLAGDFRAELLPNGRVRLAMTPAHSLRLDLALPVGGEIVRGHFADTGVPHLVVPVEDAGSAPVVELGRKLRHHPAFAPKGTNVNFAQVLEADVIAVRTYERGVEDETLACGTGAVASAVALAAAGKCRPPVRVRTRGGDELEVAFRLIEGGAEDVLLTGGAEIAFEGELDLDRLLGR